MSDKPGPPITAKLVDGRIVFDPEDVERIIDGLPNRCDDCGEIGAESMDDPYATGMGYEPETMMLCDECAHIRHYDV